MKFYDKLNEFIWSGHIYYMSQHRHLEVYGYKDWQLNYAICLNDIFWVVAASLGESAKVIPHTECESGYRMTSFTIIHVMSTLQYTTVIL